MAQKLIQLQGLIDTKDITPWENDFLKSVNSQLESEETMILSSKQVEVLDNIWKKHFA
jgi:hypothetical protein